MVGLLSIHNGPSHVHFGLLEQGLAAGIPEGNATILARDDLFDLRSA